MKRTCQTLNFIHFLTRGGVLQSIACAAAEMYCGNTSHLEYFKYCNPCAPAGQIALEQLRGEENMKTHQDATVFYMELTLSEVEFMWM